MSEVRADLVPDDLWERVAPLLPPAPEWHRRCPGLLRVPGRTALAGVMYVLRTGVARRDVPAECRRRTRCRRMASRFFPVTPSSIRASASPVSSASPHG
ncbi:transposase [Streptomyces sp. NBC_00562]|uniref:transposase n=1 Tax=Streptomyces sp. NBC_00562 TaxID=2975777 RepID=UPI003FCC9848